MTTLSSIPFFQIINIILNIIKRHLNMHHIINTVICGAPLTHNFLKWIMFNHSGLWKTKLTFLKYNMILFNIYLQMMLSMLPIPYFNEICLTTSYFSHTSYKDTSINKLFQSIPLCPEMFSFLLLSFISILDIFIQNTQNSQNLHKIPKIAKICTKCPK